MFIDTHTKNCMEESICALLAITPEEFYDEINRIEKIPKHNYDTRSKEISAFIKKHLSTRLPDEILLFHLSRRLKGTEDATIGRNLLDLLTSENALSAALKKYEIEFFKGAEHVETVYRGKTVDWEKCVDGNPSYIRSRLGYFTGREDFCFNGFVLKDLLYKNNYARSLSRVPEFVGQLIACLGCQELGNYFMSHSAYYCYEYKIPINRVLFDGHDTYSLELKQQHLVECVVKRLINYANTDIRLMHDSDNPILRLSDDDTLPDTYFVAKEEVTIAMLR